MVFLCALCCPLYFRWRFNWQEWRVEVSLGVFMPVSSQDLDLQRLMSSCFLCSKSGDEKPLFVLLILVELVTMAV